MEIEYENGLPKGYLKKRKAAGVLYIFSIYLYCLFLLLTKTETIKLADGNISIFLNSALILISGCLLCYSVISGRNFKGIKMYNHRDVKAFKWLEKLLYATPPIVTAVFFPLEMVVYLFFAGFMYLAVSRVE